MARKRGSSTSASTTTPTKVHVQEKAVAQQERSSHGNRKLVSVELPHRTPERSNGAENDSVSNSFHPQSGISLQPNFNENFASSDVQQGENPNQPGALHNGTVKPHTVPHSTSLSDDSGFQVLNQEVKPLLSMVNKLRDLGMEKFNLPLPKICVVGDQSSGKSSLVEGMSGIKVPRGEDTCTRCPLEINLRESRGLWQCSITLVSNHWYDDTAPCSDSTPLWPWIPFCPPNMTRFTETDRNDQVEFWLRRAQLAILNPKDDPEKYRSSPNVNPDCQVSFSPNTIRLDISGPECPNLSFYDLPGVIVQDKQDHVPKLIERLVKDYTSAKNCQILWTLPMNNDLANSNTGKMIWDMGAHGRTVGVITKPDLLVPTNTLQWRRILEGASHPPLRLGYWVVKNEADDKINHAIARQEEARFFKEDPRFCNELSKYHSRFGTLQLQGFLAHLLVDKTREILTPYSSDVDKHIGMLRGELSLLPQAPPKDILSMVHDQIVELARYLDSRIGGHASHASLYNEWSKTILDFRNSLVLSYPEIQFNSTSRPRVKASLPETPRKAHKTSALEKHPNSAQAPTEIVSSDNDDTPIKQNDRTPTHKSTPQKPARSIQQAEALRIRGLRNVFTLENIQSRIRAAAEGFPGAFHPRVIEEMYSTSTSHWPGLLNELLDSTQRLCENFILAAHSSSFKETNGTALSAKILEIFKTYVKRALGEQRAELQLSLKRELGRPLTINNEDFVERKIALEEDYSERRVKYLSDLEQRDLEAQREGGKVTETDRKQIIANVRALKNPPKLELSAMASTRAYYDCVAKRYAEACHTGIVKGLFEELRSELHKAVREGLELYKADANERVRRMAEISPEIAAQREQYEANLSILHKAKAYLEEFALNGGASGGLQKHYVTNNGWEVDEMVLV